MYPKKELAHYDRVLRCHAILLYVLRCIVYTWLFYCISICCLTHGPWKRRLADFRWVAIAAGPLIHALILDPSGEGGEGWVI